MYRKKILISALITLVAICGYNVKAESQNQQSGSQVLITPWPKYEFTDASDLNYILVKGSWIGDAGGQFIYKGKPTINTVDIICDKSTNLCIESRAEVSPLSGNLMVSSWRYQIIKWDKDSVEAVQASDPYAILGHSFGAGKLTLRIDRDNKTVTLTGEYETDGKKDTWTAHLDSGEKLMEIHRQKK
jgi:hypothetical protein